MRSVHLLALLALFLLLAGCTNAPTRYDPLGPGVTLKSSPPEEVDICSCMVCNYEDTDNAWYLKIWNWITGHEPETRLVGGSCKFVDCYSDGFKNAKNAAAAAKTPPDPAWDPGSAVNIQDLAKPPTGTSQDFIKFFMLGQGPTFSDFDYANSYCNNQMGLAVRWYTPDANTNVPEFAPTKDRPLCYLKNDIMPVYIYKPDRSTANALTPTERTDLLTTLATNMGSSTDFPDGIGPVIIAPEPEFTVAMVPEIADQINIIRTNCPKCMIAVIPDQTVTPDGEEFDPATGAPTGAYYPPNSALRALHDNYPSQFAKVDLIGLHFFLNDYSPECRKDEALYRLTNYSQKTLETYGKSSILLYYGAANYVDPADPAIGCTPDQATEANDYLITNIPSLSGAGIIGAAQYQFEDGGTNPAFRSVSATTPDCAGDEYCNQLGLLDSGGNQKSPEFAIWFNRCQFYYNTTPDPNAATITYYPGSTPTSTSNQFRGLYTQPALTFPAKGEDSSLCSFQTYIDLYKLAISSSDPTAYSGILTTEQGPVYGCDECIGGEPDPLFYSGQTPPYLDPFDCSQYDLEARRESEKCNFDPLMTKAVIWQESGFDPSEVSFKDDAVLKCRSTLPGLPGPLGCWKSTPPKDPVPPSEPNSERRDSLIPPLGYTVDDQCACGLMQTINDWHSIAACPNFNPFVPASSICGGTYKLCKFEGDVLAWLTPGHDIYDVLTDSVYTDLDLSDPDSQEYKWTLMWLTLLAYNAGPSNIWTADPSNPSYGHTYYDNWIFDAVSTDSCNPGYQRPLGCEWWQDYKSASDPPTYEYSGYDAATDLWWIHDHADPCCAWDDTRNTHSFIKYVNECKDPYANAPLSGCKVEWYGNPYAAQTIAKYDRVLKTCPSNCADGVSELPDDPDEGAGGGGTPPDSACDYLANNPYLLYPEYEYTAIPPELTRPLASGTCTDNFCTDRGYWHAGIDIGVPVGTPILAAHDGVVQNLYQPDGAGNYIKLSGSEVTTLYMHLKCDGYLKQSGTTVIAGEVIGLSGGDPAQDPPNRNCAGSSKGPHLHFEVRTPGGAKMDPGYFVDFCNPIPQSDYP
ncbi:MAG: peptidoglycan DD-metalloendopeptidase family protein [Candidatus Burarchaeum sp.]|nr:peptidoglycan DD-metalloendopeptidase family protein [Candidatus Burarchaeum sp.]MDO8339658.1 peptidoglycan DD-metalloendopeptidase family protein [Candidatus Burarchaeum sp.]